ncbi:MAG: glycosyltransferase family 39 protein [Clostridiaceae bacterium]|nr:glycosyltransferase family 39 protein [Clostridiaceae bacterium]
MFSLKNEEKYVKLVLAITCLLFFLICIISIFIYGNSTLLGSLIKPNNDDVKFIRSAWILVDTGKYVYHNVDISTVFMMPGLPFTLAFFVKIFGNFGGITALRVLQAVIQTGSLLVMFFIARKIFNSRVALVAILINILCITDYWVANLILTETIFKFSVLCLVYFSIYAIELNKTRYYILGGIALGLATLFRPTIATYPIIILLMWIFKKYKVKDMIKYTAIVAAIFCLILSPWWIRNYNRFHKFIPLTLATGNPMLQGTYIFYDQSTKATDGLNYNQFNYNSDSEMKGNQIDIEVSKYRLRNLVPKHPIQYFLWYTVGKTACMIGWPFVWIQSWGVLIWTGIWHYFILVVSILGLIKYYKDKNRNKMGTVLVATIFYFIGVYLPFYAFGRYFYPAMPFVIIFAASSLIQIFDYHKKKN